MKFLQFSETERRSIATQRAEYLAAKREQLRVYEEYKEAIQSLEDMRWQKPTSSQAAHVGNYAKWGHCGVVE